MNGIEPPTATEAVSGVTAMETSVGAVTVNDALLEVTVPSVAEMLTGPPALTPVATPRPFMVATAVSDEFQVTEVVMFWVDPSE